MFVFSIDVIFCGLLGSRHHLTNITLSVLSLSLHKLFWGETKSISSQVRLISCSFHSSLFGGKKSFKKKSINQEGRNWQDECPCYSTSPALPIVDFAEDLGIDHSNTGGELMPLLTATLLFLMW